MMIKATNEFYDDFTQAKEDYLIEFEPSEDEWQDIKLYEFNDLAGRVAFTNLYLEQFGVKYIVVHSLRNGQVKFYKLKR